MRKYEVKINNRTICRFTHSRSDGLATCLRRAANAVAKKEKGEQGEPHYVQKPIF